MSAKSADSPLKMLLSCEHAVNTIPSEWRDLFAARKAERALASHRGYDIGAVEVARGLRAALRCRLLEGRASRLLVDLNRSTGHRAQFSEFTRVLSAAERSRIEQEYYRPYVDKLRSVVAGALERDNCVLHLSIHSFTPTLAGQQRNADVGLLYDPARAAERGFCVRLQRVLREQGAAADSQVAASSPALRGRMPRVRRNYPYRGTADGLTTQLRREFAGHAYLGIEVELNQRLFADQSVTGEIAELLARSVRQVLQEPQSV